MAISEGAQIIKDSISKALASDEGCIIGRNGQIELDLMMSGSDAPFTKLRTLEQNAGVFPSLQPYFFDKWKEATTRATIDADVLVTGWYEPLREAEQAFLSDLSVTKKQIPLRSLEPYYVDTEEQWTQLLEDQDVAVVSSFSMSARKQVEKGSAIWGSKGVLPSNIKWHWIQTGHPPCIAQGSNEWPPHVNNWLEAANYVVSEVVKSGARIAIIGCGGLGMPIAKMLKDRGIIAIVMGGAIQILFGIKGKRWKSHPIISTFWNDEWVWPSIDETPLAAKAVEGGCYWN
jgi:hypothetical protein